MDGALATADMTTASTGPASGSVRPARRLGAGLLLVLRTLAWRVPLTLVIALMVFVVLRLLPVDPIAMLMPPGATAQDIAALTREMGLDRPVLVQFGLWLSHALQGDLGRSISGGLPVSGLITQALPVTLQLLWCALVIGLLLGLASGLLAFRLRGTWLERTIQTANGLMMAIPDFLWALLLILIFGITLRWLPFLGEIDASMTVPHVSGFLLFDSLWEGDFAAWRSTLAHLMLPALALSMGIATPIARVLHSSLLATYAEDYIQAARLRGITETRLLLQHALRNAALPTVSLIGTQASVVIGGTLLVESIYGLPGIGSLMLNALGAHDMPVIQALALTYAITVQIASTLSEMLLRALDPRIRAAT